MKKRILDAAMQVANTTPLWLLTRKAIAKQADCAPSLVTYYLGTRDKIIDAIVERAILEKNDAIVIRAKALEHPLVAALSI